jgi:hypothetical protein
MGLEPPAGTDRILSRTPAKCIKRRTRNPAPWGTMGLPNSWGSKYWDLAFQNGGVSSLIEWNVILSHAGLEPKNDCSGEGQPAAFVNDNTRPLVREGAQHQVRHRLRTTKTYLVHKMCASSEDIVVFRDIRILLKVSLCQLFTDILDNCWLVNRLTAKSRSIKWGGWLTDQISK